MRVSQHLGINASVYTIYIYQELKTGPASHATVLAVWVSLVWVDHHHEIKNDLIASGLL